MVEDVRMSLKAARVYGGFSQSEIAEELDVHRNSYINYEKYQIPMRIDTAIKFSELTGIPMNNIIFLGNNYTSSVVD
ncbi:helix-turn-helix transcriptional regulator [Dolosigranulum savutiense]|uniref:Helix-turn-helix transcriptional regulator n=1 Tax=Dolosigranulum savutiense TaxID=3110288 RepID=A0AB74TSB1_9LACT